MSSADSLPSPYQCKTRKRKTRSAAVTPPDWGALLGIFFQKGRNPRWAHVTSNSFPQWQQDLGGERHGAKEIF